MENETRYRIDRYLVENAGIIQTADFQRAGLHNKYISALVDEGRIVRVKPGLYIASEKQTASGYFEVQIAIPAAVVCLGSALVFYDLSTYEPPSVHVAVPRGNRTRAPDFPPVKRFTYGARRYDLGVVHEELEGKTFKIYDREKTICDVIRFRRTLGQDVVNETLRDYIGGQNANVDRLLKYARELNEEGPVQMHLRMSA
jgi:predicted transcriptional regulator of viral defense system